jgi:hypothetical protein
LYLAVSSFFKLTVATLLVAGLSGGNPVLRSWDTTSANYPEQRNTSGNVNLQLGLANVVEAHGINQ